MNPDQFSDFFGMAGHLAAMSEFLLRGYNVAIPFVDRGDDVLTIEDVNDEVRRVQVKTSKLHACNESSKKERSKCAGDCQICRREVLRLVFNIKADQLRRPDGQTKLFYMPMFRPQDRWEWLLIPRKELHDLRRAYETSRVSTPPRPNLDILIDARNGTASGWGADLAAYLNNWEQWPETGRSAGNFGR